MSDAPSPGLGEYRATCRKWFEGNLALRTSETPEMLGDEEDQVLQARLYDAGYSGFAFPKTYGGAGLSLAEQVAFFDEASRYVTPTGFGVSIGMIAPTILDHGSDQLKAKYLPQALRGDLRFIQLLSEPSGGSDLASVMTRATRDGDVFVINGSKMWSSGARLATNGLLLARTDWDVPKHHGVTMFVVALDTPGITIEDIALADGSIRFCQEYFDDVEIGIENVLGEVNQGWSVAHTLLLHERRATVGTGFGYGYMKRGAVSGGVQAQPGQMTRDLLALAARRGAAKRPAIRQLIGKATAEAVAHDFARRRIMEGQTRGDLSSQWGSLLKLGRGTASPLLAELSLSIAGSPGVIAESPDAPAGGQGSEWLVSRGPSIGGGTNEMQRNIVSERLLGFPREADPSRELPFREILQRRGGRS